MPPSVAAGTIVAGFRVESLIGTGAMGAVYLADSARGDHVALKVLPPELARDERFRQRFLRESQLAASLEHPSIVPTIASGEEDGALYLAMAYVEGSDLREVLRREGRLEPQRAHHLLSQVGEALDAAHGAGLVHRDVKPGNILVTGAPDGEHAYLCDFGLARHVSSVRSLTGDRGFVGTIDYVPPEQIEGGAIDGRADVYSLGCVLYECLAGARPFDRESELSVVFAHLNEPPPRVTDVRPDLPEAFDGVFATALAKSPENRYATCGELLDAARAALQGKALAPRKRRRRRWLVSVAAVLAAGVGGRRRPARNGGRFRSPDYRDFADLDRRGETGTEDERLQAALRRRMAAGRAHPGQLSDPHSSPTQAVRVLRRQDTQGHHPHHVEQGAPNRPGSWPLLERRGAEVRLRQRREAVALEHDQGQGVRLHGR
jgi:tRNA A-37 threonylcarbamoyl transferase component Bud32